MNFQTEVPTAPPPTQTSSYPWKHRVKYKSGKVQQSFAAQATPEQVNAGFSYYDSEAKQDVKLEAFKAVVVASLAGVFGVVKDANDKYYNYYSNLVKDTKTDLITVRMQGVEKPQLHGIYKEDIKPNLPSGVSYTQVLVSYVPSLGEFVTINLTVGLQQHLINAIASATGVPAAKLNLYGLCDLSSQYWGFAFSGNFVKVDKNGALYNGNGDLYFMPEVTAFVINEKPETEKQFTLLNDGANAVSSYITEEQIKMFGTTRRIEAATQTSTPVQPQPAPFPTTDTTDHEKGALPGDEDVPF